MHGPYAYVVSLYLNVVVAFFLSGVERGDHKKKHFSSCSYYCVCVLRDFPKMYFLTCICFSDYLTALWNSNELHNSFTYVS